MEKFTEQRLWRNYKNDIRRARDPQKIEQFKINDTVSGYLALMEHELVLLEQRIKELEEKGQVKNVDGDDTGSETGQK